MKTLTLAHYYTTPEVQAMADYVGDSLDLALAAKEEKADRIVFAGVKFMAETAKILNPEAEVILPDQESTCSLVTMTDISALERWRASYSDFQHVAYINSSAEHKMLSDWIVTSRNVDDIIAHLYAQGEKVIFSPDRNMGAWLNYKYGYNMPLWNATCEVHDQFDREEISSLMVKHTIFSSDISVKLIAHPESPLSVLKKANFIGSTKQMLSFIEKYNGYGTILVATEEGLLHNMRQLRPDLNIIQAPTYKGCQCNQCPYMKKNTVEAVKVAQEGKGFKINYLDRDTMEKALVPIQRMMEFSK